MNKVSCAFSDDEYLRLEAKAKTLGFSIAKLVEYAAMLYVDMPRTNSTNLAQIQNVINKFLKTFTGETFVCATPFEKDWVKMTTSAKRTAAAQLRKLAKAGVIEKVESNSKHHAAAKYKIVKQNKVPFQPPAQ